MELTDWMEDALCKGLSPEPWYPPLEHPSPNDYYAVAREVCNRCPVWEDCLGYSIKNQEKHGMWGGLTPQERNGRKTAQRPHGSIPRYRQGCHCPRCLHAVKGRQPALDLSVYPKRGEETDIAELKYAVLPNVK